MSAYKTTKQNKIKYKDAPSGYINIKKWVPPFAPIVGGFGYVGVIAEDSRTGQLQCHECGKWYEQLPTHIIKHGLTGEKYREKFGLLVSTALKSKRIRLIHSRVCQKNQKLGKMQLGNTNGYGFKKNNKESGNRKGKPKAEESQNRYGVCDLQIMTKIIELGKKLGKTPTLTDIKREYGRTILSIMHSRYGSYVKYCHDYLKMQPNFSSCNPKFKTKKAWREHLLEEGQKALKLGHPLTTTKLFGDRHAKEIRYIYKYFSSFEDYKKQLIKTI